MKIAALCFCILSATAYAQDAVKPEPKPLFQRKNELGIMAETSFNNYPYEGSIDFRGLQYKRWVKPNKAYRIIAAYGEYYENNKPVVQGKYGDTIVEMSRRTTIPNAILGVGVDMQRKFYKHIYLYASLELRASYGRGHYSYVISERVEDNPNKQYEHASFTGENPVTLFSISAVPGIGAKLQFNKWGAGTELTAMQVTYNSLNYGSPIRGNGEGNTLDMYAGTFRQRFYVYYRF